MKFEQSNFLGKKKKWREGDKYLALRKYNISAPSMLSASLSLARIAAGSSVCLLYTSDAADE